MSMVFSSRQSVVLPMNLQREIRQFIAAPPLVHNKWFYYSTIEVFLRIGYHSIHGQLTETLDIANIQVPTQYQSKGLFTSLVQYLERLIWVESLRPTIRGIYVENVIWDRFASKLERMGFERLPCEIGLPCFWSSAPLQFGSLSSRKSNCAQN